MQSSRARTLPSHLDSETPEGAVRLRCLIATLGGPFALWRHEDSLLLPLSLLVR